MKGVSGGSERGGGGRGVAVRVWKRRGCLLGRHAHYTRSVLYARCVRKGGSDESDLKYLARPGSGRRRDHHVTAVAETQPQLRALLPIDGQPQPHLARYHMWLVPWCSVGCITWTWCVPQCWTAAVPPCWKTDPQQRTTSSTRPSDCLTRGCARQRRQQRQWRWRWWWRWRWR